MGAAFIAYFGIYLRFRSGDDLQHYRYQALDLPILILALFSFGIFYDILPDLRIPLISWVERSPARMFIIPMFMLIVLSCIRLQQLLPSFSSNVTIRVMSIAVIVQMAHSLAAHSWFWRISKRAPGFAEGLYEGGFNLPSQQNDLYVAVVNFSVVFSLVALIVLCYAYFRMSKARVT